MAVPDDPAMEPAVLNGALPDARSDALARRIAVAAAGQRGDTLAARTALSDPDATVRAAALGALALGAALTTADVAGSLDDRSSVVRRRAAAESPSVRGPGSRSVLLRALVGALADPEPLVVESSCWALGERRARLAVGSLATVAGTHDDARCREAAVAALGAVGDPEGLRSVIAALGDRPSVRRRAAVALAAFDGPQAEAALRRCLDDRDWQVREVAEILLG